MQRSKMQFNNLQTDLEIINPIESKTILGGDMYLPTVTVTGYRPRAYNPWDASNPGWSGPNVWDGSSGAWGDYSLPPQYDVDPTYPDHICTQVPNSASCGPISLRYIANHFGATGLSSSDFAEFAGKDYWSMHTGFRNPFTNALSDGMNNIEFKKILDNFFDYSIVSTNSDIESKTSIGNPVLATLNLGLENDGLIKGHQVVIIGLNAKTGDITYMDPLKGRVIDNILTNPSIKFVAGQSYAITGVKDNDIVNKYKSDEDEQMFKCKICGH